MKTKRKPQTANQSATPDDRLEFLAGLAGEIVTRLHDRDCSALRTMAELLHPIEDEAARVRATTPSGAIFQLQLLAADLDDLCESEGWDAAALRLRYKRMQALAYSALRVLALPAGVDRSSIGGNYYAADHYVPELLRGETNAAA